MIQAGGGAKALSKPTTADVDHLMELANRGLTARAAAPLVGQMLDQMERAAETKAFSAISAGTFTPDQAYQLVMQKHAYHQLRQQLSKTERMGQSAAANLKPHMEIERGEKSD